MALRDDHKQQYVKKAEKDFQMAQYSLFPFNKVPGGSRVVLYGAGVVARDFIAQISALSYCTILFSVARNWEKVHTIQNIPVHSPSKLADEGAEYDCIVVAAKERFFESIRHDLSHHGIDMRKVVFSQNEFPVDVPESHPTGPSPWGRISYSFHAEDLCALFTFRALGISRPSYLDVGANHPYYASNTALMYKYGSRGINVEANPNLLGAFLRERPEDINLNVGAAAAPGILPFYVIDRNSGCSTFSREECDIFLQQNPESRLRETLNIPVMTLDQIVDEHAGGVYPDFLSIDVEGLDYQVLSNCHFSEFTPYVLCVECGKLDTQFDKMCVMLQEKGYEFYVMLADDAIFLRNGLKEKLRIVP